MLFLLTLSACVEIHFGAAQTDAIQVNLQTANNRLNQAFSDVVEAEKAGANVTSLLVQLNGAADLLAQAENTYRSGDITDVQAKVDSVVATAGQVSSLAQTAQTDAKASGQTGLVLTVAFSAVGSIVLVFVLFWVWRILKGSYIKRIGDMKPEVVGDEAE